MRKITSLYGVFTLALAAAAGPVASETAHECPIVERELRVESGDAVIAGTLSLPPGSGPHPAVILLCGTGLQDREWDIDGDGRFRMARLISQPLIRKGIAVFRSDDRGTGKSTGRDEFNTSFKQLSADAQAMAAALRERPEVGPIGICGHSGGAEIAVMTAANSKEIAFLILLCGPFTSGAAVLLDQAESFPEISVPIKAASREEWVRQAVEHQQLAIRAWRSGDGLAQLESIQRSHCRHFLTNLPAVERAKIADIDAEAARQAKERMGLYHLEYFKSFVDYNPAQDLDRIGCPVLAIYGAFDDRVRPDCGWRPLLQALSKATPRTFDFTLRVFPEANHFLTNGKYASQGQMLPGVTGLMETWILARFPHPR